MSIIEGQITHDDDDADFYHDHCRPHGNFVGDPYGPDYMCGLCEAGLTKWVKQDEYTMWMSIGESHAIKVDNIKPWDTISTDGRWTDIYLWLKREIDGHVLWSHVDTLALGLSFWANLTSTGYWTEPTYCHVCHREADVSNIDGHQMCSSCDPTE